MIKLHDTIFSGSAEFLDDGTEYVPDDGVSRPVYIGEPRRSIDHEWALLHWGRFFLLSEEEAQEAWGPKYLQYWSPRQRGYVAALEVMHTLHCLDHIRKSLYPEHYAEDSPVHETLHRGKFRQGCFREEPSGRTIVLLFFSKDSRAPHSGHASFQLCGENRFQADSTGDQMGTRT